MVDLVSFAFEENLVRAAQRAGEPWFVGKDVCACLGISKHHQALEELDADERGTCSVGTPGGEQAVIVISEPGVYRLVFRSRKPEAERFKRWLAHDVLPKLRRDGKYAPEPASHVPGPAANAASEPFLHRLQAVREARALYGRDVARVLWRRLGLPEVPPPPPTLIDEARQCLRHILDTPVHEGGPWLRQALEAALDEGLEAQALVLGCGIRVLPESEAFVVANEHPWLRRVLAGTEWDGPRGHMRVLRRLPGAAARPSPMRMAGVQTRGTVLPAALLDER